MRRTEPRAVVVMFATLGGIRRMVVALAVAFVACWVFGTPASAGSFVKNAYTLLNERAAENSSEFYVYQAMDSGFNHGFASQFFGVHPKTNAACIDDPNSSTGCASSRTTLSHSGTVFQVNFDPIGHANKNAYGGFNFVEPENYSVSVPSWGYDLTGTKYILFSVRSPSPQGVSLQFGAGGATTDFVFIGYSSSDYSVVCMAVDGRAQDVCPANVDMKLDISKSIDLESAHILFTVVTNHANAPNGGIVLLKQIRYEPFPASRLGVPSLPLSTQTFGVVPVKRILNGRVTVPDDQALRNVASLYEASLAAMAFFNRGSAADLGYGYGIVDSLIYAQGHDNAGDPLPGSGGLHNGYEAGDLALFNSQGVAERGQVRLAGFSASTRLCGSTRYCLVLDGATGGNNAFAIIALLQAYQLSGKRAYLISASRIGEWIWDRLRDTHKVSFGGFYAGYPDAGVPHKKKEKGKSTENNADIFSAFSQLANADMRLGQNRIATQWSARAVVAGDFVMQMLDSDKHCFNAGTVPKGTKAGPGVRPDGPVRGRDVTNTFPFFDANSFTYLAMSQSPQYGNSIDWSSVVVCLNQFAQTAQIGHEIFNGYNIVRKPDCAARSCGPNGIAWEFTGQAAVVISLSGGNADPILNDIAQAQASAPFGDGLGLVASTMQHGETLKPYDQCLSTPYQCIPERVGIAATSWAIFAATGYNPLWPPDMGRRSPAQ